MDIFPEWSNLQHGDSVSFVGQVLIAGVDRCIFTTMDRPVRKVVMLGSLPDVCQCWVILQAKVRDASELTIEVGGATTLHKVEPCAAHKLDQVVELCCGLGAFSSITHHLGMKVVAGVDLNDKWAPLFKSLHGEEAEFIHGSCGDLEVVRRLLSLNCLHSILLSGISCQPFSRAGDQRGLRDPRSISLPHTLRTAWYLQCPVVVLECTPEIQRDKQVQDILCAFRDATGCHLTQCLVALQDVWCTNRERWFAIFSAAPLGPVVIPPPIKIRDMSCVGLVMPYVLDWPDALPQLELTLYELAKFYAYAAGGISKAFLDLKAILPTLLHSCGNQLYACRCGCRGPLSLTRLSQSGLYGTLVPLEGFVWHENQHMQKSRYFHPLEMYLLQGGDPLVDFGDDLRLAMAGVGQCVSPLVATWILAHVRQAVQKLRGDPQVNPAKLLEEHVDRVLDSRDVLWPTPMDQADFMPDSHPVRIWDHATQSMTSFMCAPSVTLSNFLEAERALQGFLTTSPVSSVGADGSVWAGGQQCMNLDVTLHSLSDLSLGRPPHVSRPTLLPCPCGEVDEVTIPAPAVISPTIPFSIKLDDVPMLPKDCSELVEKSCHELVATPCPRLSSTATVPTLLHRVLPMASRSKILTNQGNLWADDEIRFFINKLLHEGPVDQHLMMWDPLALSSVIRFANFGLLQELIASVPQVATILSACLIENHWYAVVWRCEPSSVQAYTCGHPCNISLALQRVHQEFCVTRQCPHIGISFRSMPFLVDACCGALAIAFLQHIVHGSAIPHTKPLLVELHLTYRSTFTDSLASTVPRPWIWGLGEQTKTRLELLLQEHGVVPNEVSERATMVLSKIGEGKVEAALKSNNPWKDLKWFANACTPQLQLVKPMELQAAVDRRSKKAQPLGDKSQKVKGKGKGRGIAPHTIDPSGLRLETGLFQCGQGANLAQIDLAHVGPNASGIVLTTLPKALPFLKSGRQVSAGGLGMVVRRLFSW